MKKFFGYFRLFSLLAIAASTLTFTACGDDDDDDKGGGNNTNNSGQVTWGQFDTKLATPKYESVSGLYKVTDPNSDIESIELTASGNYIVIYNGIKSRQMEQTPAKKHFFMSKLKNRLTRGSYSSIVEGKYKQISENKYELQGWGTVEIHGTGDNVESIDVTRNGETMTIPVAKATQMPDKEKTNYLCRTWNFSSMRVIINMGGKAIYDKEYKMNQLKSFGRDMYELAKKYYPDEMDDVTLEEYLEEWDADDYPTEVVFTKAGTYMCVYNDGELAISTWTWENYDTGLLRYSWDYSDMYNEYYSGNVKVSSRGSQLQVYENLSDRDSDYEDEDEGELTVISYLNEAK